MNRLLRFSIPLFVLLAAGSLLVWGVVRAQEFATLPANTPTTAEITSRLGDEWSFQACAGETVTLLMESDAFEPLLELYGPTGRDPVAVGEETDDTDADAAAMIEEIELAEAGGYLVVAAGASVRDRGAYTLTLLLDDITSPDDDALVLTYGEPVTGAIASRLGEEWLFRGCQGDVVSLRMESREIAPRLELYGPSGRDPIATSDEDETDEHAQIEELALDESGLHLVAAIGQSIRARGAYSLSLALIDRVTLEPTATPTHTPRPTPTRTRTPSPTPTPDAVRCLIVAPALNVRAGPGLQYAPPIDSLARGDEVLALARDADAGWIQIEIVASGETGWVSASTQYLSCDDELDALDLGDIPPTPTPTNTPIATNTPTPGPPTATPTADDPLDPIGIIIDAPGPAGDDVLDGDVYTANYFGPGSSPRFQDRFMLELYVRDPDRGNDLGDGIDRVEFEITLDGEPVYSTTERTPRFCIFGGNEFCEVIRLRPGVTWPGSNDPIVASDNYFVSMTAIPSGSNVGEGEWGFPFELDFDDGGNNNGGGNNDNQGQIVAEFAQIFGNSSDALIFQVSAFDSSRGNNDGDGIDSVRHEIFGPDGDRVYERTESSVRYCAFSGGEPDCDVFRFTVGESEWEGTNNRVEAGPHRLRATVRADDGRTVTIETVIQIQ